MKLWQISCLLTLALLTAAQPATISLTQTVDTHAGGPDTVTGPIFIGANSDNGIVTSYGPGLSYWRKNSSGLYTLFEAWTPISTLSYLDLAQEYVTGNKFGAQPFNAQTTNIHQLNSSNQFGAPTQTLAFPGDSSTIKAIGFNTIGSKFITGNSDGTLNVWGRDIATNTYSHREKLYGHSSPIKAISVGSLYTIISLAENGEIIDWEFNYTGGDYYSPNQLITVPDATAVAICPSEDSYFLVGLLNGTIRQYNFSSSTYLFSYIGDLVTNYTSAVQDITFSANCTRVVSTAESMIYWQFIGGKYVATETIVGFNPLTVNIAPT